MQTFTMSGQQVAIEIQAPQSTGVAQRVLAELRARLRAVREQHGPDAVAGRFEMVAHAVANDTFCSFSGSIDGATFTSKIGAFS